MLFGILSNLAVIIIIIKNRLLRRQVTNLFLLNMAISDLLNLTFNTVGYYFWMNVQPSPSGVIFNQYYFRRNPYIQCKTRVQNFGCHITSKISCNKCKFLGWKKCLGLLPFPMLCIPMVVSQVSGQVVSDAK